MKRIIIVLAAIVIGLGAASAQKYIVVDSEKILLALLKTFFPPIVTALSAAIATACLLRTPTIAVINSII